MVGAETDLEVTGRLRQALKGARMVENGRVDRTAETG